LVFSSVVELDSGAGDEGSDRLRHQDLVRFGDGSHPGTDMYRHTTHVIPSQLHFTGVQARTYAQPQGTHAILDRTCASDRPSGSVKRGKEPVANRIDLPPAKPVKLGAHQPVM
jgi:hypothetical protein